jgi:MFS-type transporter involved in bile tolerance (Atg22 family)
MHLMGLPSRGKTGVVMGLYAEAENMGGIVANPAFGYAYTVFGPLSSVVLISVVLLLTSGISAARLKAPPTPS